MVQKSVNGIPKVVYRKCQWYTESVRGIPKVSMVPKMVSSVASPYTAAAVRARRTVIAQAAAKAARRTVGMDFLLPAAAAAAAYVRLLWCP